MMQLTHSATFAPTSSRLDLPRSTPKQAIAASPTRLPAATAGIDEQLFGVEAATRYRAEDSEAFTAVSWILFAIVMSGCLLMLGTVLFVA